ncbi:MAG TPA: ATP-binding protein, partial [Chloroflexota bacterium]|nr:ATP-binding protein [Chloroflexota bacterium]
TSFESAFVTKSGRVFPIEVRIRPAGVDGEQVLIAVASDLSERKRAETQLVQAQRLHALGEMAAGVVHDINNMLTAALGPIEVILASTTDPLTQRLLQPVQQALLDGARTVRRIQAFARQNVSTQFTPIDLIALAYDVVELIRPRWQTQARQQGLAFEVEVRGESVPPILGSSSELREALINLLNNAIDAMPGGGRISITVNAVGNTVQLQVTDTGVGMPSDVLQRIFDPFFTTKGVRGSGLGLSVVYGIVARQRGQIAVESIPGQGTTFTLTFPIAAIEDTLAAAPYDTPNLPPTTLAPGEDLNVLVIDDQASVATVLQLMLEMDNHRVRVCASGAEGLAALHEERFDLVCTDINMPEMNGWEMATVIKAEFPDLPVAFVTGWSESYDEHELQARGVDYVLRKPYQIHDVQELVSVISRSILPRTSPKMAD